MSELRGIYTLWMREVKRYLRERIRIVSSFFQPLLWLIIFGTGMRFPVSGTVSLTYQKFIFPGIIGQTLLFTSMFMGISVIWDREFGFLKEILVAPISRFSIFVGKMLGASTDAMIQGIIVFSLGFMVGIPVNFHIFLQTLPLMLLITFGLVCIGLTIASFITSLESYGAIQSFINLPLFFLSGALFPLSNIPSWLQWVSFIDPLTYGVDAMRTIILGSSWVPLFPLHCNVLIVCAFDVIMITVGTLAFNRRR